MVVGGATTRPQNVVDINSFQTAGYLLRLMKTVVLEADVD
jgi:hypothetical protein